MPTPPRVPDAVLGGLAPLERDVAGQPVAERLADAYATFTSAARDRLLE